MDNKQQRALANEINALSQQHDRRALAQHRAEQRPLVIAESRLKADTLRLSAKAAEGRGDSVAAAALRRQAAMEFRRAFDAAGGTGLLATTKKLVTNARRLRTVPTASKPVRRATPAAKVTQPGRVRRGRIAMRSDSGVLIRPGGQPMVK